MTDSVQLEHRTDSPPAEYEPAPKRRVLASRWTVVFIVGALMVVSAAAQLVALRRDLPLPDTDEHFFVEPAVRIASTGDPNPEWFGHPGSTVIYPTAALVHVWDAVAHDGPLLGGNADLQARFDRSPTPFYLLGRLWTVTLAVATLPFLFALGRRAFNTRVALIATALWAVLPLPTQFGRIVRTESAGVLFTMMTLWCCLRALEDARARWWIAAGVGAGLALSSRYFLLALIPCVVAVAVFPRRHDLFGALKAGSIAFASIVVTFVATTPFFVLDFQKARDDLRAEATLSHPVAEGFSRLGNARWYLTDAIPDSLSLPIFLLAALGIVLVLPKRRIDHFLLLAFCGIFFVGISISKFHWQRWTLQLLPILMLFAAATIDRVSNAIGARAVRGPDVRAVVAVVITAAVAVVPISDLADLNRDATEPTARKRARDWIVDNLSPGSRVLHAASMFQYPTRRIPPVGGGIDVVYDSAPERRSLATYVGDGFDYVVVSSAAPFQFLTRRDQDPGAAAFYEDLACTTRLFAQFDDSPQRGGGVSVYRLDQQPERLLDYFCKQPTPDADTSRAT